MKESNSSVVQLLGFGATFLIFAFTVGLLIMTYRLSQSPPPFLTQGTRPSVVDISFLVAGLIQAVVGVYITRNVFKWSRAQ